MQIRLEMFLYTHPSIRHGLAGWLVYAGAGAVTLPVMLLYLSLEQLMLLVRWPTGQVPRGIVFRMVAQYILVPLRFLLRSPPRRIAAGSLAQPPLPFAPPLAAPLLVGDNSDNSRNENSHNISSNSLRIPACDDERSREGDEEVGEHPELEPKPEPETGHHHHHHSHPPHHHLTCVTYNIQSGMGLDGVVDLHRTSEALRRLVPDVIALQEVEMHVLDHPVGNTVVDQAAHIASRLGLPHSAFCRTRDLHFGRRGDYGIAVVSRYPIEDSRRLLFSTWTGRQPRAMLLTKLLVAPRRHVWFGTMHLQNDMTGAEQQHQLEEAFRFIREQLPPDCAVVIGADCNMPVPLGLPGCHFQELLLQYGMESVSAAGYDEDHLHTYPSGAPLAQFDVFLIKTAAFSHERSGGGGGYDGSGNGDGGGGHIGGCGDGGGGDIEVLRTTVQHPSAVAVVHHAVPDDHHTVQASDHLPLLIRLQVRPLT